MLSSLSSTIMTVFAISVSRPARVRFPSRLIRNVVFDLFNSYNAIPLRN